MNKMIHIRTSLFVYLISTGWMGSLGRNAPCLKVINAVLLVVVPESKVMLKRHYFGVSFIVIMHAWEIVRKRLYIVANDFQPGNVSIIIIYSCSGHSWYCRFCSDCVLVEISQLLL